MSMKKKERPEPPPGGQGQGQGPGGRRRRPLPLLPFLSLRDYGLCMAALLLFCLGSLCYQLGGGPPRFLLDLRHYLGKREGLSLPSGGLTGRVCVCLTWAQMQMCVCVRACARRWTWPSPAPPFPFIVVRGWTEGAPGSGGQERPLGSDERSKVGVRMLSEDCQRWVSTLQQPLCGAFRVPPTCGS